MSTPTSSYDPAPRALAAILFTDVAGFSAMVGEAEGPALAALARDFKLITGLVEQHGGKVVKNLGDGLLVLFPSAVQATECALEVQGGLLAQPQDTLPRLGHRMGLHLGDVVMVDGDALGDGVNVAARLQAEADPGGICLSQTIFDTVKGRVPINAKFAGELELKNIVESVRAYKVQPNAKGGYTKTPRRNTAWRAPVLAASIVVLAGAVVFLGYAMLNRNESPPPPDRLLVPVAGPSLADYKMLVEEAKRANEELRKLREERDSKSVPASMPTVDRVAAADKPKSQTTAPRAGQKPTKPPTVPDAPKHEPDPVAEVKIDPVSIKETVGGFLSPDEMKELDIAFATLDGKDLPKTKRPMQIGVRVGQLSMVHAVVRTQMAAASREDPIRMNWPGVGQANVWQGDGRDIVVQRGATISHKQWRQLQPKEMSALMKACVADPKIEMQIPKAQIDRALKALESGRGFRTEYRYEEGPGRPSKKTQDGR
ncbi:MAG: hypothetical protein HONBIEJF_00640 [Fimbriimonadaceae bacterium]|nr:hypothetical protein [Fimbriimonadaceae bacterium]